MKNLCLLLTLIILISCSKNEEIIVEESPAATHKILLQFNYKNYVLNELSAKYFILHDQFGNIYDVDSLTDEAIITIQHDTTELISYSLTILNRTVSSSFPNSGPFFHLETFNNIESMSFDYSLPDNFNNDNDRIELVVENIGSPIESFHTSGKSNSATITENRMEFSINPRTIPSTLILTIKRLEDDFSRSLLLENVFPGDAGVFDFQLLSKSFSTIEISYPENVEDVSSTLKGYLNDSFDAFSTISRDAVLSTEKAKHYIPDLPLSKLRMVSTLKEGDKNYYSLEMFGDNNIEYNIPELDFEKNNSIITTNSIHNCLSSRYRYNDPGSQNKITWDIFNKNGEEITLMMPDFESYLSTFLPEPDIHFFLFDNSSNTLHKIEGVDSYIDFLKMRNNIHDTHRLPGFKYESVTKL